MDATRRYFFGLNPEEQKRKCTSLIRSNTRKLDRDLANLKALEAKTRTYILQASKRAQRNPSHAESARKETRTFARELLRVRRQGQRLATSKATLASVGMQVNEAFAMRKIEGSLRNSTGIMRDVNMLVRMPELTGTMRELSQELVKAGIIEEMAGDVMDAGMEGEGEGLGEDEEAETEVDRVLGEVLRERVQVPAAQVPDVPVRVEPVAAEHHQQEEEDVDSEEMLAQMRGRLEALKS